ncbi:hypothetical protein ABOM_001264 [Aspergillus bombycis]|uniref:Calcineurin-like phosphoesterase domain-containing protein n=1 Tax=Aspergillus bombycis TaxID=109264 RepID=A0A1F8AFB9_9EURO|nr:hypothetical protein ABOM_001264 [Aspergillus bombycis]OGM50008.1 hypothetical protein ABOM_001264 [Aspergillus bombycis]
MLQNGQSSLIRPSISFQILSDLHLEINSQYALYDIPVCAGHLILAGDIGRLTDYNDYRNFLQKQTDRFKLVFLILGNHEFYNGTFATGLEKARQLEREPGFNGRLIVLHQNRYDIPGSCVTILGCTLWSHVPHESREIVQSKVKDFQRIEGWSVEDHNANHDSDLAWLVNEVQLILQENREMEKRGGKRSVLVATHHAPLLRGTSSPQHAHSPWGVAFATDVLSRIPLDGVKVWVFGHTHYTTDFREGEVRVVSNQRGYVLPWNNSRNAQDGFDVKKVIRVS